MRERERENTTNSIVLREVNSGGATLNDAFMHGSLNTVAFGGVGHSGTGSYRGRASFEVFTHRRSVAQTPSWMESLLRVRYMPYDWKERRMLDFLGAKPNFDRNGRINKGLAYWLRFVFGLGSQSTQGAFRRWSSCAVVLMAALVLRDRQGMLTVIRSLRA